MSLESAIQGMATPSDSQDNDRDAYLSYVEMCQIAGKTPLSMAAWIAAGRPKQ